MRSLLAVAVLSMSMPGPVCGEPQTQYDSVTRVAGLDAGAGIEYALISVTGRPAGLMAAAPRVRPSTPPAPMPRLTAQCTRTAGKLEFELLADFGIETVIAYYPPWKPSPGELFPPRPTRVTLSMEFLGYTKMKPVRRQWEQLQQLNGEWRYAAPGLSSANMEPISYYLQYLKALPRLRLTLPGQAAAEWETTGWLQALHADPLCGASGI